MGGARSRLPVHNGDLIMGDGDSERARPAVGQIWRGMKKGETWLVVRIAKLTKGTPSTASRAQCEMMEQDEGGRWVRRVTAWGEYYNTSVKLARFGRDFELVSS